MKITTEQFKASRVMLSWKREDVANRAGVSLATITNLENETRQPYKKTIDKVIRAYELEGIVFIKGGVQKTDTVLQLEGADGFQAFLDDVYTTAITYGTKKAPAQVYLSNVVHENWVNTLGEIKWKRHTERMIQSKDVIDVRIIVKEGDWNFPAIEYSKYKWVKPHQFNNRSFYSYHDKLAFLNFTPETTKITVIRQQEFAEGYRTLFLNTWDYVAFDPKQS